MAPAMLDLKIDERHVDRVVILDLHGRLVIGQGQNLLREAVDRLAAAGNTRVVLNLADVPFIDSSVVGELVRTLTTLHRKGGKLKLLKLPPRIRNLFTLTRLLDVFEAYDSEDEAVRSF